ncbi:MAG TPA: ANTAR domain-containing protein [Candidatus Limnocylindrales bacterium]|nr:ANTAR domain-containing protein [Candidatus Limnocylindrales bacterium]
MLTEQLQGALNSRVTIEQAKGALAQARGVSVDDAFVLIRSYARGNNRRLGDVARTVLTDPDPHRRGTHRIDTTLLVTVLIGPATDGA